MKRKKKGGGGGGGGGNTYVTCRFFTVNLMGRNRLQYLGVDSK